MANLAQDVSYGMRMLKKRPGFTAIAVITLALGIGANTAIFSVVNGVLLKPLQFEEPDRLVMVWEKRMSLGRVRNVVSPPDFADWRAQNRVFEEMAAFTGSGFNLTNGSEPERLQGAAVSPSLFQVLRGHPQLGRVFEAEEDKEGQNFVAILGGGLWQRRFAGDPEIVGKTIRLNDQPYTVVGVMPKDFAFPNRTTELWVPLTMSKDDLNNRGGHNLTVIARMKPEVSLQDARTEMDALAAQLEQQYQVNTGHGANVFPLYEEVVWVARPALLVLLGAVAFVLLIACANVANLLLARAATRQKEMAIRTALGASRFRVIRQLLTESVMLALVGGTIGVLLALWGMDMLLAIGADSIPRVREIELDGSVLGFSLGISLLTGLIFGLVPALQASRPDLNETLKEGGRDSSVAFRRNRVRSAFIIGEVAVCLVLLIGAGLMIRSFKRLLDVNPGFNPEKVLVANIALSGSNYRKPEQVIGFYRQALERISAMPGVESASTVSSVPMAGNFGSRYFGIEGRPPQPPGQGFNANVNLCSPGYFQTMNVPLVTGRAFDERDSIGAPDVIVINQTMARTYWPDEDPLGQRVSVEGKTRTIVGIVGDVKHSGLDVETRPEMFWPHYQRPIPFANLVVRTSVDPQSMIASVRGAMKEVDSNLPLYNIKTLDEVISSSVAPRRLNVVLLAIFGGLALVLAAVGLFGVMSYLVTQRTREIGVRMALGARGRDVVGLIVKQGLVLTSAGLVIGLVASFFLTRLLSSLLFDLSATDPLTFAAIALLLGGVATLACYLPARRATKVDPMIALRCE